MLSFSCNPMMRASFLPHSVSGSRQGCNGVGFFLAPKENEMKISIYERFWSKVCKKEVEKCWEWLACKNQDGYGRFMFNGKVSNSHRISWILTNGDIPFKMQVLHHCDNPSCVNLKHLFLGTQKDNILDMWSKNRGNRYNPSGDDSPSAKLNSSKVKKIRKLLKCKLQYELAKMFNVSKGNISCIARNITWKNL